MRLLRRTTRTLALTAAGDAFYLDFSSRKVDLIRDGYDVVVRSSLELPPGLVARVIHRDRAIAVASPEYLADHGVPWPRGRGQVHVESSFSTNEILMLRQAAASGLGIVCYRPS